MKKAILIDSTNKEIKEVTIGEDYTEISKAIGCQYFDVVHVEGTNYVYVDDEGLMNLSNESRFFKLENYEQPLSGNGLILGVDDEGNSIDTDLCVEDVRKMVKFMSIHEVKRSYI